MIGKLRKRASSVACAITFSAVTLAFTGSASALDMSFRWASDAEIGAANFSGIIFNPDFGYETLDYEGKASRRLKEVSGFRAGAEVGYDKQIGHLVVGVVADLSKSFASSSRSNFADGSRLQSDLDLFGTVRGKVGYAAGRWMIFGTGGLSYARLRIADSTVAGASEAKTLSGYAAGGGIEYIYNKDVTIRFEYTHLDFGDAKYNALSNESINPTMDVIGVGVTTRF